MSTAISDLKVEVTDVQPCVKKLHIEIPEKTVAEEVDNAIGKIGKTARVPGFRKGKVPKAILERMYADAVLYDVGQKLIYRGYEAAINDNSLRVYGDPAFEEVKVEKGRPISFTATVETLPGIDLPDFSGWEFTREQEKVSDADVDKAVGQIQESWAELVPVEGRSVLEGDYIMLDYTGTVDGKVDEKLSGKNKEMMVSTDSGNILADFHREITGLDAGAEKEFTIRLSKQFPDPALADKEVSFKVTVNAIKEKKLPEITDDFVKANTPYQDVADMRGKIKERAEKRVRDDADYALRGDVMEKLIAETKFDLPPKMLDEYIRYNMDRKRDNAARAGKDPDSIPGLEEECRKDGERAAREEILLQVVAEKESVKPDTSEIARLQKEYADFMISMKLDARTAQERALNMAIKEILTKDVYNHLFSKLKIADKYVEKSAEKEKK